MPLDRFCNPIKDVEFVDLSTEDRSALEAIFDKLHQSGIHQTAEKAFLHYIKMPPEEREKNAYSDIYQQEADYGTWHRISDFQKDVRAWRDELLGKLVGPENRREAQVMLQLTKLPALVIDANASQVLSDDELEQFARITVKALANHRGDALPHYDDYMQQTSGVARAVHDAVMLEAMKKMKLHAQVDATQGFHLQKCIAEDLKFLRTPIAQDMAVAFIQKMQAESKEDGNRGTVSEQGFSIYPDGHKGESVADTSGKAAFGGGRLPVDAANNATWQTKVGRKAQLHLVGKDTPADNNKRTLFP